MSVSASIDIHLVSRNGERMSTVKVVQTLLDDGWTLDDHGQVSYLPVGDRDDFDFDLSICPLIGNVSIEVKTLERLQT
ncbi:hypothetical protein JQC72_04550 [Polycladomyces sp. WAk]|uniref:Uncharacterized protein n=1 Tax=Polycladomyces zharkentensis TaxID=2807616 RepID=A0ABS2WGX4_9BACL|nr:hypothetical protein [Polycladomyces sp. WAk]MBN2908792.1 hypothetical protein [Polycladomyces sp. WAk]